MARQECASFVIGATVVTLIHPDVSYTRRMAWEDRWQTANTPWDAGASPPILAELVQEKKLPEGRAFVPGCGAGYDLVTLASPTRHVTGLDVAPGARDAFYRQHPEVARDVDYIVGDFFAYEPEQPFDLFWDYTFLCALDPSERQAWADKAAALLKPGGMLATLIFPIIDALADYQGPPWPMSLELVQGLVLPTFEEEETFPVERSHPGREGKEWLALWRRP